MGLLKNDNSNRNTIKGKLGSILSILDNIASDKAIQLIDWFISQSEYADKYYNNKRFHKLPDDIKRGDIVLVEFGINIHPELSDDGTNFHFGLVWGQQGQNFIILPITKRQQPESNKYAVNLGIIEGMPVRTDAYLKIDAIRSVSVRRIHRIREQEKGKIVLSDEKLLKKVSDVFYEYFVLETSKKVVDKTE